MCEFAVQRLGGVLDDSLSFRRCNDPMRDLQISIPVEWPPLHLLGTTLHGYYNETLHKEWLVVILALFDLLFLQLVQEHD